MGNTSFQSIKTNVLQWLKIGYPETMMIFCVYVLSAWPFTGIGAIWSSGKICGARSHYRRCLPASEDENELKVEEAVHCLERI